MDHDEISVEAVTELLAQMVAIPSINPAYRRDGQLEEWFGEARMADFVEAWLKKAGLEAWQEEVLPGRSNVVAWLAAPDGAPRMIWEGHLDTVQVDGMADPFRPEIRNGRLYGRGAVDDKGCLAMFMLALRALAAQGAAADITFVAAIDEEVAYRGVMHHIVRNEPYDMGIAGEPTSLNIMRACKGVIRWTIDVKGRGAHSAKPEEGINAIAVAARLLDHLRTALPDRPAHPLLGGRTLTCTLIEGGEGANSVPAGCRMTFDFRTLPDQTGEDAWQEVHRLVEEFAAHSAGGATLVMNPPFLDSVSMEVPEQEGIVKRLALACRNAGCSGTVGGVPFGSDASKLTRAGTPTVIFGPGRIGQAHAIDEYVEIEEVALGARILVDLARNAG